MKLLIITYEVDLSPGGYVKFYNVLRSSEAWWHYMTNTWLLHTKESPQKLYEKLAPIISKNDKLLIIEITNTKNYYGWLPSEAWKWIEERLG